MKSLKLNKQKFAQLTPEESNNAKGGATISIRVRSCGCSCYYANSGGSSSFDNGHANSGQVTISENGNNHGHLRIDITASN